MGGSEHMYVVCVNWCESSLSKYKVVLLFLLINLNKSIKYLYVWLNVCVWSDFWFLFIKSMYVVYDTMPKNHRKQGKRQTKRQDDIEKINKIKCIMTPVYFVFGHRYRFDHGENHIWRRHRICSFFVLLVFFR